MKQGYEQGISQCSTSRKSEGKMETMTKMIAKQLTKKLGYLSENIVIKINNSNEDVLNELIINIFDINKEDIYPLVNN